MEDAFGGGHVPGEEGEGGGGEKHDGEGRPEGAVACRVGELIVGGGCLGIVSDGLMGVVC